MELDFDLLRTHIKSGLVREQRYETLPLAIYSYSQRCQFDRCWDDVTMQCRGLVLHGDVIVARPFRKFFNDSEHAPEEIPWHLSCEVTEKLDGSLLIVFHFDGHWLAATRGLFDSEQAERGWRILNERYGIGSLDPSITYLFEVIYPENRIVVNYGDREDVILLAMIETATGRELPIRSAPHVLTLVRRLPPTASIGDLRSLIRDDEEGYVVRFDNGFRVKVKGKRYLELHRLISNVSSRLVWEHLSQRKSLDELLEVIPDEFGDWVRAERDAQIARFNDCFRRATLAHNEVRQLPDRKSQALLILDKHRNLAPFVFAILDGKDAKPIIWRDLYPEYRRPEAAERLDG